jgi:hypothetical protein
MPGTHYSAAISGDIHEISGVLHGLKMPESGVPCMDAPMLRSTILKPYSLRAFVLLYE